MIRQVNFYRTSSGNCPVETFLEDLSGKRAQKVAWVLALIEELDVVPAQYFKKLTGTDDLWEVRVKIARETIRLLGFFDGRQLIILTNGFVKKTQQLPHKEIQLAEKRKQIYLRRQSNE